MAHDADMFNRWAAAQTLLADQILKIAHEPKYGVDETAVAALAKVYANSLADPALLDMFKSGLLTLPAISVLESRMRLADPVALFHARRAVEAALGAQGIHQNGVFFRSKSLLDRPEAAALAPEK